MPDDDVLTRAKRSRDRWIELRKTQMAGYPTEDLDALISLAQSQAKKLAEIREQCVNFTPDPDLVAAIIAIIDGKQP